MRQLFGYLIVIATSVWSARQLRVVVGLAQKERRPRGQQKASGEHK